MVGIRRVLLIMRVILYTTSPGMSVTIAMTGLVIGATIGPVLVMEIVGVLMVGAVRSLDDLVKSPPLGGLATRSSLFMILDVSLGALGAAGILVAVESLQHGDSLPVVALQPRGTLRRQRR